MCEGESMMSDGIKIVFGEYEFGIELTNVCYELFYYNKRGSLVKVFSRNISDIFDSILKEISEYYKSEYSSVYYYNFGEVWYAIEPYGIFYKVIKIDRYTEEVTIVSTKDDALESVLREVADSIQ